MRSGEPNATGTPTHGYEPTREAAMAALRTIMRAA
jgi:hypothetical protein